MEDSKAKEPFEGADPLPKPSGPSDDVAIAAIASDDGAELCISEGYEEALFNLPASDRVVLRDSTDGIVPITGSDMAVNTEEAKRVLLLRDAACIVRRIANAKYTVFKLTERRIYGRAHVAIQKTGLAGEVRQLLRDLNLDDMQLYFPEHRFNPYVDLWFELLRAQPRLQCVGHNWEILLDDDARQIVDELNTFVTDIQEAVRAPAFRAQFDRHRRRCDRNTKNLRDYIKAIFKYKGVRQVVIRLDLGYSKTASPFGTLLPTSVSLDEAREDLAKLLRHVRDHFPLTGYAWKLEFGLEKGYHFHLLLFMNGHLVREDVTLARQIGEYWQRVMTEGQGRYFNCNAYSYRNRGIGTIDQREGAKRAALMDYVAPYLTKVDFWMYFDPPGKTFGKGQMPMEASKAGRPRKVA